MSEHGPQCREGCICGNNEARLVAYLLSWAFVAIVAFMVAVLP